MKAKLRGFKWRSIPSSAYILIALLAYFGLTVGKFATPANLSTMILQAAPLVTISMGMAVVIMAGGVDLSVGGCISLAAVVAGQTLQAGAHWTISICAALGTGLAVGILNGLVVQKLRVVPFIATFGMASIAQGLANTLCDSRTVYWEAEMHPVVKQLGRSAFSFQLGPTTKAVDMLEISYTLLVCVFLVIVFNVLFRKTRLRTYIYAIGENQSIAHLAGIHVEGWRVASFAISGALAGLAGYMLLLRTQSVQPTIGDGMEFYCVVAAVLGGNSLKGGKGSVPDAICGALVLYSIRSALTLSGVSTFWVQITVGGVLIVGLSMNNLVELIRIGIHRRKGRKNDE